MRGVSILRAAERRPQRWKNGGGVTSEVLVHPPGAGMDDFAWRVSIALVKQEGAFSCFAGVERVLAVLEGELDLKIEGTVTRLDGRGQPITFPGDVPASGRPRGGPVRDINLMVRRRDWFGRMRRSDAAQIATIAQTTIILVETAMVIEIRGRTFDLAALDALVLERGHHAAVPGPFLIIEIQAPPISTGRASSKS